jgi:7-cyano-7-deazaguanine synthase in queuosine biosynthesis
MRHLVLLSGGPDSVLALKECLLASADPVVALHVMFQTSLRWEREMAALNRIVPWVQVNLRPFEFLTARVVMPQRHKASDMLVLAPFAASVCLSYGDIGKTWSGEDHGTNGETDRHMREAIRWCMYESRYGIAPPAEHWPPPGQARTKAAIKAALGEPLWGWSWSCRQPTRLGEPCGHCDACQKRAAADAAD